MAEMQTNKVRYDCLSRILISLIAFCLVILVYFGVVGIIFLQKEPMPIYLYTNNQYYNCLNLLYKETNIQHISSNKDQIRQKIEQETNINFYFYLEKNLDNKYNGLTFITIRTIIIDKKLTESTYGITFCHECMHMKKYRKQENYICFETFKTLYESEDAELHYFGAVYGLEQLYGYYDLEYSCQDQIVHYLLEKN